MMKTKTKTPATHDIVKYSSSMIFHRMLGIGNAFIKPKILSPELYGLWTLFDLIRNYTLYAHIGSRSSMRYLIPYNESIGAYQNNKDIKGSVFYGSFYINATIAIVLIAFSFRTGLRPEIKTGFWTMAFVAILQWYYEYHMSLLKAYQNFSLITASTYLRALLVSFLGITLIYVYGIYGAYLSIVASYIAIILYLKAKHPLGPYGRFQFTIFKDLVKHGFPIMIFNFITVIMKSSDKMIIAYFLGTKQLGYYGIAFMVFSFMRQIPGAAREVLEPRLMEDLKKKSAEENLKEYFFKPLFNTAYFMPFLIGPTVFLLPLVIPLVLPRYIPGIVPTQIIVLGSYFFSLSYTARGIIVANGWQRKSTAIIAINLMINILLNYLFITWGMGITGVAIGSSISYLILLVSFMFFIKHGYNSTQHGWKNNILGLCWPYPIMCTTIIILIYFMGKLSLNEYGAAIINLTVFSIIMYFVLICAQRKYALIKEIKFSKLWTSK